ncbi:hypothetical protein ACFFV7_51070 [Nonomuraea spiralis]|uniref:Uncharacterized protein n=1 Tax=Nonomuraea spiralis TaxID=46182 RepID=A0ABV5IYG3_9ACTN|nr:hypothetical protein [Nonomuraea spiralis]GGS88332.1 hypothetical protein GCM10010176_035120 [Nonomuraea spiralis]
MDFTQVDNPFDPWHSRDAVERQIAECAARPAGHAWTIQGDTGEWPWLACDDCPASGDDLYADILDLLDGQTYELGGRTIVIGKELPDDETSMFKIPVDVRIAEHRYTSMNSIGYEYDVEILITDRETAA